jgi:ribosomal-protein-alanine N-acetyltransferase
MEAHFSLRPATSDDLATVIQIEQRVHIAPWTREHFQIELEKPYSLFFLLTDDETDQQIAGYLVSWVIDLECEVLNLAVDLPFRGLGLAKSMLSRLISFVSQKGVEEFRLYVRKSNVAAIQLYQGFHFDILRIHKNFYSNGEDAYHMVLSLKNTYQF